MTEPPVDPPTTAIEGVTRWLWKDIPMPRLIIIAVVINLLWEDDGDGLFYWLVTYAAWLLILAVIAGGFDVLWRWVIRPQR